MKPGRELDALIAEKVMGAALQTKVGYQPPLNYSTDIAAAWQVVDKLYDRGWDTEIQVFQAGGDESPTKYCRVVLNFIADQEQAHCEFADTAPHAICLAALNAVDHEAKE